MLGLAVLVLPMAAWWINRAHDAPSDVIEPAEPRPASVAVLPFTDMSEAGDQGPFADGLADCIIHLLTLADGRWPEGDRSHLGLQIPRSRGVDW